MSLLGILFCRNGTPARFSWGRYDTHTDHRIQITNKTYIKLSIYTNIMSGMKKMLLAAIPEQLKYRLDRTVLEEKTTIQKKVTEILDKALPEYDQE